MATNFEDQYAHSRNKPLPIDPPPGGWDKITNALDENKEPRGKRSKIGYYTILFLFIPCLFVWIATKYKLKKDQTTLITSVMQNANQEADDLGSYRQNSNDSIIRTNPTKIDKKGTTELAFTSDLKSLKTSMTTAIKPQKRIQSDDIPTTNQRQKNVYTITPATSVNNGNQDDKKDETIISVTKSKNETLKQISNENDTVSASGTTAPNKQYEGSINKVIGPIPVLDLRVRNDYQYPMKPTLIIDSEKTITRSHKWRAIASMGTPLSSIVARNNSSFLATSATSLIPDANIAVLTLTREGQPIYIDPSTVDTLSLTNFNPSFAIEVRRSFGTRWEVGFGATYLDVNSSNVAENPAKFGPGLVYRSIQINRFNILTNLTLNYNFEVGKFNSYVGTQLHFNLYEQDLTTINTTEYGVAGKHVSLNYGYKKWNPSFTPTPSISFGLNYDISRRIGMDGGIQFIPIKGSLNISRTWWRIGCYLRFQ